MRETKRSFNPMPGGRRRNAVFYSVLRAEWPSIREQLLNSKVGRREPAA